MTPSRPTIRADVFPAILTVAPPDTPASSLAPPPPDSPARQLDKVRVIVTADTVYVFQDSHTGPALIFSERLTSYTPPPRLPPRPTRAAQAAPREATLQTDSGKTLAFHRSGHCGCGSRLKGFNPFDSLTTYSSSKDALP